MGPSSRLGCCQQTVVFAMCVVDRAFARQLPSAKFEVLLLMLVFRY